MDDCTHAAARIEELAGFSANLANRLAEAAGHLEVANATIDTLREARARLEVSVAVHEGVAASYDHLIADHQDMREHYVGLLDAVLNDMDYSDADLHGMELTFAWIRDHAGQQMERHQLLPPPETTDVRHQYREAAVQSTGPGAGGDPAPQVGEGGPSPGDDAA